MAGTAVSLIQEKWTQVSFKGIEANKVSFENGTMAVAVNSSASPLVYKLEAPLSIQSFEVSAAQVGSKVVESSTFDEDSVLRFGIVGLGSQKLNAIKRAFAADWVIKLFSLAPADAGLDKIHFFNVSNRPNLKGQERVHPKSDLMIEKIISVLDQEGKLAIKYQLEKPIQAAALWLSIDGDDTKSKFTLKIDRIDLN